MSSSVVRFTRQRSDPRKKLLQVLKVDSRQFGWTILGSSVPGAWSRGRGVDTSPGVGGGQSRKEGAFHLNPGVVLLLHAWSSV